MRVNSQTLGTITSCALERFEREPSRDLEAVLAELRLAAVRRRLDNLTAAIDAGLARKVNGPRDGGPFEGSEGS